MKSKLLDFLLDEKEINKIAKEIGLCKRIRKFKPIDLLKMVVFHPEKYRDNKKNGWCYYGYRRTTFYSRKGNTYDNACIESFH